MAAKIRVCPAIFSPQTLGNDDMAHPQGLAMPLGRLHPSFFSLCPAMRPARLAFFTMRLQKDAKCIDLPRGKTGP